MIDSRETYDAHQIAEAQEALEAAVTAELTAERDQARRIAVDLENENARLRDRVAEIRAFCPEHGDRDTCRMICHCAIADELEATA